MASNGSLAEYFLKIGVKIDKTELKKIDGLLKDIEKRLGGVGKAQVAEAKATDTATKATKRKTKAEKEQEKAVKDANTVAAHQLGLRQKWLKQQDKIADSAKKVHDFQMKLMRQAQSLSNANTKQEVKNAQTVAKAAVSPRSSLSAKQIGANRRAFFASTHGIEVRTGYNKQYRLGEQQSVNAAKAAQERVNAEKEANRKIEQDRKDHLTKLQRQENAAAIHKRTMDRIYGRTQAQQQLQQQAQQNWLERQRIRQEQMQTRGGRSNASYGRSNFLHAGGAAGAFMRYGAASLPLIGGAYSMSALNQANQNLVSNNIAAESVLGNRSGEMLDWLSAKTNYTGASYADTLPQFTKFMASAQPLMGADASKDVFASFLQFGRTRGADKVSMNRALTAVAQMSAKGQVMAEELNFRFAA